MSKKESAKKEKQSTSSASEKTPKQPQHVKVVLRRLPKCITEQEVLEQCSPLPDDLIDTYFSPANPAFDHSAFATFTLVFRDYSESLLDFERRFDGYVFVDSRGNDSAAVVEAALNQHFAKCDRQRMREDPRVGAITADEHFIAFCESLEAERARPVMTIEQQLRKLAKPEDARTQIDRMETPLVKFYLEKEASRRREMEARKWRREEKRAHQAGRSSPAKNVMDILLKKTPASKEPKKSSTLGAASSASAQSAPGEPEDDRAAKRKERDGVRKKKFMDKRKEKKEENAAENKKKAGRKEAQRPSPAKTVGEQQGEDWIKKLTDPKAGVVIKKKHDLPVAAKLTSSSPRAPAPPTCSSSTSSPPAAAASAAPRAPTAPTLEAAAKTKKRPPPGFRRSHARHDVPFKG